jgi:hypothetical protein
MGRIRTIKPEFPQSESVGRLSRDARLLFVELWTVCDDSGRARAASRMLASLLFPYDEDAPAKIGGWLAELEREGMIVRYAPNGDTYLQVCKWLSHQKIDKPSPSKIPPFDEHSRIVGESSAKPREHSSGDRDQGSGIREGTKDQGSVILSSTCVDVSPASPDDAGAISLELVSGSEGAGTAPIAKRTRKPDETPYVQILEAWARHCPHLTQPRMPNDTRQRAMRSFWQTVKTRTETPHEWIDWLFKTVAASDFLSGRKTDFRADLFWVIAPRNLAKIVDGNFNNRKNP